MKSEYLFRYFLLLANKIYENILVCFLTQFSVVTCFVKDLGIGCEVLCVYSESEFL